MTNPRWWLYPLAIFAAARLGLFSFAWLLDAIAPDLAHNSLGGVLGQLCEYDCLLFRDQTITGYLNPIATNFFPGFILLTRAFVTMVPVSIPVSLVVVANLASIASFLVLYRIFATLADDASARIALALFAFYPFAFFQASGYPESLAILLTASAFWLSLRDRPVWAGLALAGAVLVRHVTALAGLSLLAMELERAGDSPKALLRRPRTYALLLPVIALAGYCTYCGITFGDPLSWLHARSNWGNNAWRGVDAGLFVGHSNQYTLFRSYALCALVLSAGAIALVREPRWRTLGWYGASLMLTLWLVGIYALGRYSASCWPAFLPLGAWLSKRPALATSAIGFSAMLQIAFFFLHNHRFGVL